MKKLFTTIFMVAIGVITSFAQVYTVNITPNNPELGEVVIGVFPQGAIKGVFSVSENKKVAFSQGNLQYQASTDTWRFAENQYDMVGMGYGQIDEYMGCVAGNVQNSDNREISSSYSGWIDLFGWGTGNNPTNTSNTCNNSFNGSSNYLFFVDWGVNKISNGGNVSNAWFTLSYNEWKYLLDDRPNASAKQGVAMVNGVNGLVLLPDNWTLPSGAHFTSGVAVMDSYVDYKTVNTYTASEWTLMEEAGAVFLPAAGERPATSVYDVGCRGYYWSCTDTGSCNAGYLYFNSGEVNSIYYFSRYLGLSVRLCSEFK